MADSDTVKALLYACLAFVGFLITVTIFFIYTLVFRVKRQFVYHISVSDSTTHPYSTREQRGTESSATTGLPETIENQGNADDDRDTDSLTRNLSFRNFERPVQPINTAHQESIENQVTSKYPETIEHPQITLNEGRTDDGKDTDSLTRNISLRNVERPEQSVDTAYQENVEATIENQVMIMHSEAIEHPVQTTENIGTMDDDKDSDILSRGRLSFTTFERLIEYAGTEVSETTDHPETTGYLGIQGNAGTSGTTTYMDSLTHAGQPATEDHSGNLETITENYAGIPNADDYTNPTDYTRDDSKNTYSLTPGILINNHQRATTGHPPTSGKLNTNANAEITENEDSNNNNDNISAISSSNTEKQVSFSGNDSTYIVQRKEKTVQLIQYDETSNFEFVKFARQHQKKT
ncbi:Hypothetical predicted protein [Paramuricea clavata]|uniref:Uncharacterized protein n=1 Tax=Paramuricea clavata TaxID=317549 RepID=A0A7D9LEK0_PARCT|nr:Hypothetical predicted protein [Paramuricea clavata]